MWKRRSKRNPLVEPVIGAPQDRANTTVGNVHTVIQIGGSVEGGIRLEREPPSTPAASPSRIWTIPARNPHFTGRADLLAQLEKILHGDPRSVGAAHSLHGMGGVGKTQLVIEYAYRHVGDYDLAWWVPAEQPELIPGHLARLGQRLGLTGADEVAVAWQVVEALRERSRWLVVFDNAEDPDTLRPYLPGSSGDVLVTTRRTGFRSLGRKLDVDVLTRAESVALLHERATGLAEAQADELAEWVGDLPLALEQAAAYLDTTDLPPDEYLGLLRERGGDMLGAGTVGGYPHTLATVWSLSLARLGEQCPAALELLALCAYLAPDAIPLDLFTEHAAELPAGLAAAAGDRVVWADTVGALVGYALIRRSGAVVSVHRLLQTALRHQHTSAPAAGSAEWHRRVLELLRVDLPGGITGVPEDWPRWQQMLPHVLAATGPHDSPVTGDALTWLLDRAATYLQVHGQLGEARPLFERALAITEAAYGPHHPTVATRLNNLAGALRDLGQPSEARPLYERALAIDEATYGPHHPTVTIVRRNLASLDR
jgi:tetratricopeptide (TPR) repeat protein